MNVKIYKPARNVMQSGRAKAQHWLIEPELPTARGPESLMGWTSSGDTLNQIKLEFATEEDAVRFAEAKGWAYTILPPQERKIQPRNYVDNFKYVPAEDSTGS